MRTTAIGGLDGLRAATPQSRPRPGCVHSVQFYESEAFLDRAVAEFVGSALRAGRPALVIVRPERWRSLLAALERLGEKSEEPLASGRLRLLDAETVLAKVMEGSMPSQERLAREIGGAFADGGDPGLPADLCAYGEMVELLWRRGNREGALALEAMWNRMAEGRGHSILCSYAIGSFGSAADAEGFQRICRQHDQVLPTEHFLDLDEAGRLGEITRLQQRARALEAEIERRREAELRLREVLELQAELLRSEQAARLAAQEASRVKQDFLSMMSHELRTPLNAIAGFTELLELEVPGPLTERQQQYLRRIRAGQQRLLGLIDGLLSVSDVEESAAEHRMEAVVLGEVVHAAGLHVLPQLREKGIELCWSAEDGLAVFADRARLQRILFHLLSNAVKFATPGGEVRVEGEGGAAEVVVRVRNAGPGIPADKLEAVFEPFYQVDSRLTREHQGAGLGLPISRRDARRMGGDLTVESAPGAGTVFTLRLRGVEASS